MIKLLNELIGQLQEAVDSIEVRDAEELQKVIDLLREDNINLRNMNIKLHKTMMQMNEALAVYGFEAARAMAKNITQAERKSLAPEISMRLNVLKDPESLGLYDHRSPPRGVLKDA